MRKTLIYLMSALIAAVMFMGTFFIEIGEAGDMIGNGGLQNSVLDKDGGDSKLIASEKKSGKNKSSKKNSKSSKSKNKKKSKSTKKTKSRNKASGSKKSKNIKKKAVEVMPGGRYTSREEVAEYIYKYGELPVNYITKKEAKALGWDPKKGNLQEVAKGKSIGGDVFRNLEKKLPDKKGRVWREADIGYFGGRRNGQRIVFSNDGHIYYTGDHYKTFKRLNRQ